MAIRKTELSLRLAGEYLVGEEITSLLGRLPTSTYEAGHEIGSPHHRRLAKTGMWILSSECASEEFSDTIIDLLNSLNSDLEVWSDLTSRFHVDIYCGLFLTSVVQGFAISPTALLLLSERGIELSFDIYWNGDR